MGASACCFTADNVREEAKAHLTDATFKDNKHVQFNEEAAAESSGVPGEVKTQRTKDRKGTGYVKPEMFKDLVDEDDD